MDRFDLIEVTTWSGLTINNIFYNVHVLLINPVQRNKYHILSPSENIFPANV